MKTKSIVILFAGTLLVAGASAAKIISTYQFPGVDINEAAPFRDAGASTSPDVIVGPLIETSPLLKGINQVISWLVSWNDDAAAQSTVDLASAIANNSYFQFSVSPKDGYKLDLNGGNLKIRYRYAVGSLPSRPTHSALMFSASGFKASDYNIISTDIDDALAVYPINNPALNNLIGTQTFRIYFWNDKGTGAVGSGLSVSQVHAIDGLTFGENIVLSGNVSSYAKGSSLAAKASNNFSGTQATYGFVGFCSLTIVLLRRTEA